VVAAAGTAVEEVVIAEATAADVAAIAADAAAGADEGDRRVFRTRRG